MSTSNTTSNSSNQHRQQQTSDHPGLGAPRHWLTVPAHELVENQHVVQVDSEATIEEACDALIQHNIQSVPLYDARSQTYVGMFDLHDLAAYILAKRPAATGASPSPSPSVGNGNGNGSPLMRRAVGARGEMVSRVADMSHVNPFYSVLPETKVAQVAQVFAKGAHRVAVMEDERRIRGILSQTRVVRYFFEHCSTEQAQEEQEGGAVVSGSEDALLDRTLEQLGLVTGDVVVAQPHMPVIQALSLLEQWHVSSLALVDAEQRLVGNLSVGDIKYLAKDRRLLNGSCMDLVQAVRFMQGVEEGRDRAAVFSVRPEATLRYALSKLVATGAHRVWITRPRGNAPMEKARGQAGDFMEEGGQMQAVGSCRRASVSSASAKTVAIAPPHYAGAFDDAVCGVVSLTDVMRLLTENAPSPQPNPEYNYASMD
ncbi:cell separation during budding [Coemansia interrupta]|uniref:Cell separation during budding n=1 Tax=Coemansia interrupta TaxID=1126814 RepID=A0A9W8H7N1_9FUNG|nr:cell separation during budding [Coemansia interrupta]